MPITRRHFELGINNDIGDWMLRIYAFLALHKEEAYTKEELASEFGVGEHQLLPQFISPEGARNKERFDVALGRLVELGAVDEREVAGNVYYARGRRALSKILKSLASREK